MKGANRTPHTAVHRGKWVRVVLVTGEEFIDRFWDRSSKWVYFKNRGKVRRGLIKIFTLIKGNYDIETNKKSQ